VLGQLSRLIQDFEANTITSEGRSVLRPNDLTPEAKPCKRLDEVDQARIGVISGN
jgi:hypothetical protein